MSDGSVGRLADPTGCPTQVSMRRSFRRPAIPAELFHGARPRTAQSLFEGGKRRHLLGENLDRPGIVDLDLRLRRRVRETISLQHRNHHEEGSVSLAQLEKVAAPLQIATLGVKAMHETEVGLSCRRSGSQVATQVAPALALFDMSWSESGCVKRLAFHQFEVCDQRFEDRKAEKPRFRVRRSHAVRIEAGPKLRPDLGECRRGRLARREHGQRHAPHGHLFDDAGVRDLSAQEHLGVVRSTTRRLAGAASCGDPPC